MNDSGLKEDNIDIKDVTVNFLITNYCRESGVRNLQKQIEKVAKFFLFLEF